MAVGYPIRAVARLTGIPVDTLRAWERRYGAVTPDRDDRGRLYNDRNVARLKQLSRLVQRGHGIGSIASLTDAALRKLDHESSAVVSTSSDVDLSPVLQSIRAYDHGALEIALNRHAVLLPAEELVFSVVLPLMREVGRLWEAGALRPAQEHLISALVRNLLGALLRTMPQRRGAPVITFAAPPGERHELGLLCGALLAARAGYSSVYLGPDLPVDDIMHAATTVKAGTIVMAATCDISPASLKQLRKLKSGTNLWVGGLHGHQLAEAAGSRALQIDSLADLSSRL